jgi:signal transduction histidine kinase
MVGIVFIILVVMSQPIDKKEEGKSFFVKRNLSLVLLVIVSSALLIAINYYTIKTTSAVRAYINGESRYSKGQKDGARHLITYLTWENEKYYQLFNEEIKVPLGDSMARVALMNHGSYERITEGFLQGKNHEDDIGNMIWLFKNFKNVAFMKKAIGIWKEADVLTGQLQKIGGNANKKFSALSSDEKEKLIMQINVLTTELTIRERAFSDLMGATARKINFYLFIVNFFLILFIITCVVLFAYKGMQQLIRAQSYLKQKNKDLNEINHELDHFISSASHDLKSPINNIEGLMRLLRLELGEGTQDELFEKMERSIGSLRKTVGGLMEVIKIDNTPLNDIEENTFESVLNEFIRDNQQLLEETGAKITTAFAVAKVTYSSVAIKSIIQNLLTNAIKYRSRERNCMIHLKTTLKQNSVIMEVRDNGIGMDLTKNGHKLFKMFTRLHDHVEGTGIGLYMIKRIVEKRGGEIRVESSPGAGTTFFITLV